MVGVIFRVMVRVRVSVICRVSVSNRVGFKHLIRVRMYLFRTKWSDRHLTVMFSTTRVIESCKA